jgi:hypothetical protein
MTERRWDNELQLWIYDDDVNMALNQAQLAVNELYNGDRAWAERWLVRAYEANQGRVKK